jgi:hypothetical protein
MSDQPIAGRIWVGRLRVTASVTAEQDFDFVCGVVQEAIYFEFGDGHPDHGDRVDLTVGLCDDPIVEGQIAVLLFPAVVTIVDPDLVVTDALSLVAEMVRETINGWYERPENFIVCFAASGECREILG